MSDLELFAGAGDTLAERMRAAVEAEGLLALVGDAKKHVRRALADAVTETSEQTGTSFTAKHEGWAAQFTDPQPKPHVSDPGEFAAWAETTECGIAVLSEPVLEVNDHLDGTGAARQLRKEVDDADPQGVTVEVSTDALIILLFQALNPTLAYRLPEDPFGPLLKAGRIKVTDTAVVDLETGEPVPGTKVTCKDPELRLTPKGSDERRAAKQAVAEKLGVNLRALEAGGDS